MFRRKTVFVVGAGASAEFDFPLGGELKTIIADKADIEFSDVAQLTRGSSHVAGSLQKTERFDQIDKFFEAGRRLSHAMPQAISIDNYLESHSDDAEAVKVGKLCIAAAIMEAEEQSDLAKWRTGGQRFNLSRFEETWLSVFVKMLSESLPKSSLHEIFKNISIITFNYDRCIEHFLMMALASYYHITPEESQELCKKLTIYHPYGKIGALEWQGEKDMSPFGSPSSEYKLDSIASRIRTFSERMDDDEQLGLIHSTLDQADVVVYLGFSFGKMNMDLLSIPESMPKQVFATTYGLSQQNQNTVQRMIGQSLGNQRSLDINFEPSKCAEFLRNHWNPILY
jgi:hypothetical protein